MAYSLKTNFRDVSRLQHRKDIVIDQKACDLIDRMNALRNRQGVLQPEEMGFTKEQWMKLSSNNKELKRINFWKSLEMMAMTDEEFEADLKSSREAIGI